MTLQIPAATAESQLLAADAIRQTNAAADAVASSTLSGTCSSTALDFTSSASSVDLSSPSGSGVLLTNIPTDLEASDTGFAILKTDTGNFLLAKGNAADGFQLLSQEDASLLSMIPQT